MKIDNITKSRIALYYYLVGKGFTKALRAFNYAERFHSGTRKDGVTPEFAHQIWIANYARTLRIDDSILEDLFSVIFIHDVMEDFDVGFSEITEIFGERVSKSGQLMTKKHRGTQKPFDLYIDEISLDLIASIAKGIDRLHNITTMVGVFSVDKQKQYIDEVENHFYPMLKKARKNFPCHESVFINIQTNLESRIALIKAIHQAIQPKE